MQSVLPLKGHVACAQCGKMLAKNDAAVHTYYRAYQQEQEYFCPTTLDETESCVEQWRQLNLRLGGM